jgi:hypothetical protein
MTAGACSDKVYSSRNTPTDNPNAQDRSTIHRLDLCLLLVPFHALHISDRRLYQDFLIWACKELPSRLQVLWTNLYIMPRNLPRILVD